MRTLVERLGELDADDFRVRGRTKRKASIDAAGCQKKIVRKIVDKHADYLISLKGNQSTEGALRAKRPVFQRSADSIQRNWPLAAERCAAEHFGRRPLASNGSRTGENGPDSRAWS